MPVKILEENKQTLTIMIKTASFNNKSSKSQYQAKNKLLKLVRNKYRQTIIKKITIYNQIKA